MRCAVKTLVNLEDEKSQNKANFKRNHSLYIFDVFFPSTSGVPLQLGAMGTVASFAS